MSSTLHRLCRLDELEEGSIGARTLPDGHRVAIFRVAGEVYVTDDLCTHGAASLADEGSIEGCIVECSWHFGTFDVRTGMPTAGPCTEPLRIYRVEVAEGEVWVEVAQAVRLALQPAGQPAG